MDDADWVRQLTAARPEEYEELRLAYQRAAALEYAECMSRMRSPAIQQDRGSFKRLAREGAEAKRREKASRSLDTWMAALGFEAATRS